MEWVLITVLVISAIALSCTAADRNYWKSQADDLTRCLSNSNAFQSAMTEDVKATISSRDDQIKQLTEEKEDLEDQLANALARLERIAKLSTVDASQPTTRKIVEQIYKRKAFDVSDEGPRPKVVDGCVDRGDE